MKYISLVQLSLFLFLCLSNFGLAQNQSEPRVATPWKSNLDSAATGKWWIVAEQAANGQLPKQFNRDWKSGDRHFMDLRVPREQVIGFCLYTVHQRQLKLTAQLYPLYPDESRTVQLDFLIDNKWSNVATATVNDIGWSAGFRVGDWDATQDIEFRVRHGDAAAYTGTIRKDPVDKSEIVVASLSCNSSRDRGTRENYVRNISALDPDLIFFAGDQSYDHKEHTAAWLLFGRQFGELLRNRPSVTIPDDHDIGQPNLWGEGGIKGTGNGNGGGYIYHPEYVNMVERCQTAHLPDPFDPKPIAQGINVYYTSLTVGAIDFAIIEDRKFKSGPRGKIPKMGPRPDHIVDPSYNAKDVDQQGLVLLGQRQLNFLREWSQDWTGAEMKAVLSQSPFCGAAHLHGGKDNRLVADLDSNGWPQTPRNNALREMRSAFAIQLAGDQHLSTLVQQGVDQWNDSIYSFTSPAIVNTIYSRFWAPPEDKVGANREDNSPLPFTGEYLDGFDNKLTMHAYANPDVDEKGFGAGFAVARFNKADRTITFECWPRFENLEIDDAQQFVGWPRTINQIDNYNLATWVDLPELDFKSENAVVQIFDEIANKPFYTIRVAGNRFTPRVPKVGSWAIKVGKDKPQTVVKTGLKSDSSVTKINVDF